MNDVVIKKWWVRVSHNELITIEAETLSVQGDQHHLLFFCGVEVKARFTQWMYYKRVSP